MIYRLSELFEKPISGEWGSETLTQNENTVGILRTTNFSKDFRFKYNSEIVNRDIDKDKIDRKKLVFGDIIIEKSGGSPSQPVGRVLYYDFCEGLNLCNNFTSILRPKNGMVSKFLAYQLQYLYDKGQVLKFQNKTTGIINLKLDRFLKSTKIPLPPLPIQKKIVQVLDKAQELIDLREKQIQLMDDLVQSVFYDMFGDPVSNPEGWDVGTIRDLSLKTQYGTSKKAHESLGEFSILRMGNITYNGKLDLEKLKYIDLEENELDKYLVYQGEVLFNRTNSKELVGKTTVYNFDKPMAFAGYLIKLIPNHRANGLFISTFMNTIYMKLVLLNMAKNIVGMANINAEELKKIKIYIPPIELQNTFADKVQKIEAQKALMQQSLEEMKNNYNSLMQRAFRGDLFKEDAPA